MFNEINPMLIEKAIFRNPNKKSIYKKADLKKVIIKNNISYQIEMFTVTQVFHKNYDETNIILAMEELMSLFNQAEIWTTIYYYAFKITSKGKVLSNKKKCITNILPEGHNKEKNYIIKEGMVVPPLVDLGVMTSDGKVVKA